MERRSFLALIGAGVIGAGMDLESFDLTTVDTDRLLWVPGKKKIFLPSQPQQEFVSLMDCTKEVLRVLERELRARGSRGFELIHKPEGFRLGETGRILQANIARGYGNQYQPTYINHIFSDQSGYLMDVPQLNRRFCQEYDVTQDRFIPSMKGDAAPTSRAALRRAAEDIANQIMAKGREHSICGSLPLPMGVEAAARVESPVIGLSVRGVRGFDVGEQRMMQRFDVITG